MAVTAKAGRWFRAKLADAGVDTVAPSTAITDATGAAGANPTQAEYAALVAKFNSLLAAARTHGIIAS